ncbi:MAG: signal recognition particle-docking protein FtsY [Alphaproteobacteria bacterium]
MNLWSRVKSAVTETFSGKVTQSLGKTASKVSEGIKAAVGLKAKLDAETRDMLEEVLLQADVGITATTKLLDDLQAAGLPQPLTANVLKAALAGLMESRLAPLAQPLSIKAHKPYVVLMVGVNGSGKTTTLGKLAGLWASQGHKVVVAAADTFRAGAVAQLGVWAERAAEHGHVEVVEPEKEGADPAGVAFQAVEQALKTKADVVLIDTAGRLTNRKDLMDELAKIRRVIQKLIPSAPHAGLLVLDGTQGQTTLAQVREFAPVAGITGLVVTKLDSSAKAGFLLALAASDAAKPVHYIGVGEKAEDLGPFDPEAFARGIVGLS